jgi:hypothetical protein
LPVAVGVALAVVSATIPLLPESIRPWNFAVFGAIALFLGARGGRAGLPIAFVVVLGAKAACDAVLYSRSGFDPDYVPAPSVYCGLAAYALLGWVLLRDSRNPLRIGGVAFLASACFFLITNTVAWRDPIHGYSSDFNGLLASYTMALPFWRGTLASDLGFTALLFVAEYLWVASSAASPKSEPIPISTTDRS